MESYFFRVPPVVSVAFEVLCGKYGNNEERKKKLKTDGYDYNQVQSCVNELVKLFNKYGEK